MKEELYQCPYEEACQCAMDEHCNGCETWAEFEGELYMKKQIDKLKQVLSDIQSEAYSGMSDEYNSGCTFCSEVYSMCP